MVALRNIWRAWLRSLITVLGIGGGVALHLSISAISNDLKAQIQEAISVYNLDVVVYERKATSPFSSRIGADQMSALQASHPDGLTPMVLGTRNEPWNAYALIIGAPSHFARRIPLLEGQTYVEGENQVMVGEIAAARMQLHAGSSLPLDGKTYRVSAIFRTGSRLFDGGVLTDVPLVQRLVSRQGESPWFTLALLQTPDRQQTERLMAEVTASHPDLKVIPGSEFAGSLRLLKVVDAFVQTLSLIAMLGVCLVSSNTLLMAVTERTREIGILMAIGWSPWLVLRMLCIEGWVLGLAGLLLGDALAHGLLWALNHVGAIGYGWIPQQLPLSLLWQATALTFGVVMVSMLWPALMIWRMEPMEAIRRE